MKNNNDVISVVTDYHAQMNLKIKRIIRTHNKIDSQLTFLRCFKTVSCFVQRFPYSTPSFSLTQVCSDYESKLDCDLAKECQKGGDYSKTCKKVCKNCPLGAYAVNNPACTNL